MSVLAALLAGYVMAAAIRGDPSSNRLIIFWGWLRWSSGRCSVWRRTGCDLGPRSRAAIGIALMSGILVGEGVYGLTFVSDTTSPPYWWGSILAGLVLLGLVASTRLSQARPIGLALGFTALVAGAFVVVYSQDLIAAAG